MNIVFLVALCTEKCFSGVVFYLFLTTQNLHISFHYF